MSSRDLQAVEVRDIHALTPPRPPPPPPPAATPPPAWETSSSAASVSSGENFTTMSREFNALVLAGSAIHSNPADPHDTSAANNQLLPYPGTPNNTNLERIGEEQGLEVEEMNPLAIVPDNDPIYSGARRNNPPRNGGVGDGDSMAMPASVQRVKKEEVEAKISAWQNAKVAKINNRFKMEDVIIGGWENEQVYKATSSFKKIERKLEERKARAMEKMQNEVAKARRKAEEKRATAEGSRGTKVARVVELGNLMRAVGRPPAKRSFF